MSIAVASNYSGTEVNGYPESQGLYSGTEMARWEQFEIRQLNGEKWELLGAFADLDLAKAMARSRGKRMRLIRAVYEDGLEIEQDVIADLGATRDVA